MEWYYIDSNATGDDRRKGPWSSVQMVSFASRGIISGQTLVWHAALNEWQAWSLHSESAQAEVPPDPHPVQTTLAALGAGGFVIAKPFAGFWIRGAALFIDSLILQVFYMLLYPVLALFGTSEEKLASGESLPLLFALLAVQILISGCYHVWFVKKYAGTPGKILVGLSVVRADGLPMTWSTAILRYLGTWLSSLTLGMGYVLAAFDDEKRTLHDHLAKTRVLKK